MNSSANKLTTPAAGLASDRIAEPAAIKLNAPSSLTGASLSAPSPGGEGRDEGGRI